MAGIRKRLAEAQDWRATVRGWMKLIISLTIFLVVLINGTQMLYLHQRLKPQPDSSSNFSGYTTPTSKSRELTNPAQTGTGPVSKTVSLTLLILFNCVSVIAGMLLNFVGASYLLNTSSEPRPQNPLTKGHWKYSVGMASPGLIALFLGTALLLTALFSTTSKIDAMAETPNNEIRGL